MKLLDKEIIDVSGHVLNMAKYIVSTFDEAEICELFELIYDSEENDNLEVMSISNIKIKDSYDFIEGGVIKAINEGENSDYIIDRVKKTIEQFE